MRITVFGASGRTGTQVVRQALALGHEVVAVVRDPARLAVDRSERLTLLTAEVTDPAEITPAIEATDAVVSALGPRPGDRPGICATGTGSVLRAMAKVGVARLVVVSASGPFVDAGDGPVTRYLAKPLLRRLLRDGFADLRAMEVEVRGSGLDWTIMRPPQLTDRPGTGRYRTSVDVNVRGGIRVSRTDVATAALRALTDPATIGHSIGVAN
jgi:putative NADH-flavin reductase